MIRAATTASLSSCRTVENRFAIVDSRPPTTTPIRPNQAALTRQRLHPQAGAARGPGRSDRMRTSPRLRWSCSRHLARCVIYAWRTRGRRLRVSGFSSKWRSGFLSVVANARTVSLCTNRPSRVSAESRVACGLLGELDQAGEAEFRVDVAHVGLHGRGERNSGAASGNRLVAIVILRARPSSRFGPVTCPEGRRLLPRARRRRRARTPVA
jgi:hypothetical protein